MLNIFQDPTDPEGVAAGAVPYQNASLRRKSCLSNSAAIAMIYSARPLLRRMALSGERFH